MLSSPSPSTPCRAAVCFFRFLCALAFFFRNAFVTSFARLFRADLFSSLPHRSLTDGGGAACDRAAAAAAAALGWSPLPFALCRRCLASVCGVLYSLFALPLDPLALLFRPA